MAQSNRSQGVVANFDINKGFGFITCNDGSGDLFVHASEIYSNDQHKVLQQGQSVEFEIIAQDDGRRKAINVIIIQKDLSLSMMVSLMILWTNSSYPASHQYVIFVRI